MRKSVFSITPYAAERHAIVARGTSISEEWQPCRVIGVDASDGDVRYIVEMRDDEGSSFLARADLVRTLPPRAA